ncbi:probable cytochrome P450 4d20 [Pieris napi]|uniref:probable cytochrome P450 4d20 n=1 Tax=Pieris napi TaxID=78633 RepID=UPI001FB89062|nr:probable cytochrome P450 4d20 [Pieris napi]
MFFILVVTAVVLLCTYELMRRRSRNWKLLSQYPGDYPLPIVGNGFQLGFDADDSSHKLMEIWKKHGRTNFRMTVGSEEWVLLSNPDDIATILNHPTELGKQVERNTAMAPFFGNSVSTSEGERWKTIRKMMAPSFHFKTQEKRVEHVNKYCDSLFKVLDDHDGTVVDMYRYLRPYMFDILCNSLMGVDSDLLSTPDHPYLKASAKVVNIITQNFFSYWRNIKFIFQLTPFYKEMTETIKTIRDTSTIIIAERKKELKKIIDDTKNNNRNVDVDLEVILGNKVSDDMCLLDKFLLSKIYNGEPLPEDMINDEITLVSWTGHYTTTMTMAHTLYSIAKYPEVQKRILEEQQSIYNKDFTKKPTNTELTDMKYLEATIKESIRTIPTVTKIGRQLKNDLEFKDGRKVPADTTVIVFYEAVYQDPKTFHEPEKFNPDRFFEPMHNHAFVPFSAGPRNCLGFRFAWVAMKATISNIIRRYELSLGGPGTEPQFAYRIVTESKNGLQLRLKKRTSID